MNESLERSVRRELAEETGIKDVSFLVQIGAYGDPGRDPRGRVISTAFIGILAGEGKLPQAGDDAADAQWHSVEEPPAALAFDHAAILGDALLRLAAAGQTSGVLFVFLPDPFTEQALNDALRAVYGVPLNPKEYLAPFLEKKLVCRAGKGYRFVGQR